MRAEISSLLLFMTYENDLLSLKESDLDKII